jgi:hypothetical protein
MEILGQTSLGGVESVTLTENVQDVFQPAESRVEHVTVDKPRGNDEADEGAQRVAAIAILSATVGTNVAAADGLPEVGVRLIWAGHVMSGDKR